MWGMHRDKVCGGEIVRYRNYMKEEQKPRKTKQRNNTADRDIADIRERHTRTMVVRNVFREMDDGGVGDVVGGGRSRGEKPRRRRSATNTTKLP